MALVHPPLPTLKVVRSPATLPIPRYEAIQGLLDSHIDSIVNAAQEVVTPESPSTPTPYCPTSPPFKAPLWPFRPNDSKYLALGKRSRAAYLTGNTDLVSRRPTKRARRQ